MPTHRLLLIAICLLLSTVSCNRSSCADTSVRSVTGKLVNVEAHWTDIVFAIEGDEVAYYINHGLDHGMSLEGLQALMLNDTVTIKHTSCHCCSVPIDTLLYRDSVVHTMQGW